MVFETLSVELQNLMLLNFYNSAKSILIFIAIAFSLIYLFFIVPKQKETILVSRMLTRFVALVTSASILGFFPLLILWLNPSADFYTFYNNYLNVYRIFILTFIILFAYVDFYYYGFGIISKLLGIKVDDPKINKVYSAIFKRKVKKFGF